MALVTFGLVGLSALTAVPSRAGDPPPRLRHGLWEVTSSDDQGMDITPITFFDPHGGRRAEPRPVCLRGSEYSDQVGDHDRARNCTTIRSDLRDRKLMIVRECRLLNSASLPRRYPDSPPSPEQIAEREKTAKWDVLTVTVSGRLTRRAFDLKTVVRGEHDGDDRTVVMHDRGQWRGKACGGG